MALNQKERFLAGLKFGNRYKECPNEKPDDRFGDFWGLSYEIGNFHDHKGKRTSKGCDDIGDYWGWKREHDHKAGKSTMMVPDEVSDFWRLKCEIGSFRDHKKDGGETDMVSDDIVNLLPQDPFDMNISTQVTAFTGWFGNLGFRTDEIEVDAQLFNGLNIVLNGRAMRIHQDVGVQKIGENSYVSEIHRGERLHEMGEVMNSNQADMNDVHCDVDGSAPSDALFLALGYLSLSDLLSVERVCKPLRDAVRGDTLLWRNIHVDHPLSCKITDDILPKLTDRAQGHLHCLSLVHCFQITDSCLTSVLERNSSLKKLCVPGCGRLTADGVLHNLKLFKSRRKLSLKYLAIDGLVGVTNQHLDEFKALLGVDSSKVPTTRKPQFFQGVQPSLSCEDDRPIDIEICPKCQKLRLVYDCPSESCQKKQSTTQLCRACTNCIKRCTNCGRCLNNCEYEELFNFDLLCLDCSREFSEHRQERLSVPLENSVLHKQASCHFFLSG